LERTLNERTEHREREREGERESEPAGAPEYDCGGKQGTRSFLLRERGLKWRRSHEPTPTHTFCLYLFFFFFPRATKKAGGTSRNGRDSKPKFLGVKKFGGESVIPGNIIVRQRGTKFHPGRHVGMGRDHTIYSLATGQVKFWTETGAQGKKPRKYISVVPGEDRSKKRRNIARHRAIAEGHLV